MPERASRKIGDIVFELDFASFPYGESYLLKEYFFNVYEPETLVFIRKALRHGDIFIDVGAGLGYFTAVGASLVGKTGQTHAFEPSPLAMGYLQKLALQNPDYRIVANHCALGDRTGTINMDYASLLRGHNTLVPNLLDAQKIKKGGAIDVPVMRLDEYLEKNNIDKVTLIKIDVEGYELPVLQGLERYFQNTPHRPPVICEIVPLAYPLLGYSLEYFGDYMRRYGYEAYNIYNPRRRVNLADLKEGAPLVVWKQER